MPGRDTRNDLSLQELEGDDWGDPPEDTTRLIRTALTLRRKPVKDLSPEDLRLLIGQHIGLDVLVPLVVRQLKEEPLLEGDLYPGDVLMAVLRVPRSYWEKHVSVADQLATVLDAVDLADADLTDEIIAKIRLLIDDFRGEALA